MRRAAIATAVSLQCAAAPIRAAAMGSERKTGIADVVSLDRKMSNTGLYTVGRYSTVKPVEKLEDGMLLARTEGLTPKQRQDLEDQNVELVWVRETPGAPGSHGVLSKEEYGRVPDDLYGTAVVPYVKVTKSQAESIANMASKLPEPEKEARYVPQPIPGDVMSMWHIGPGC